MLRLALAAALVLVPAVSQAQVLDTRAASQRACLAEAQRAGLAIVHIARPVPIMGRLGEVLGETVRMQVAGGAGLVRCTYDIGYSEAEIDGI